MPRRMYIESGDQITVVLPLGGQVFKVQGRVGLRVVGHEKVMDRWTAVTTAPLSG